MRRILAVIFLICLSVAAKPALADEWKNVDMIMRDHRFIPSEIDVPANANIVLHIINYDSLPQEFDCVALGIKKGLPPNVKTNIPVPPLQPGTYKFTAAYETDIANGVIVAQ